MVQTRNGNSSIENADSGSPTSQLKETLKAFMSALQTQQKNFQLEMQQNLELFQQQMLQGQNIDGQMRKEISKGGKISMKFLHLKLMWLRSRTF